MSYAIDMGEHQRMAIDTVPTGDKLQQSIKSTFGDGKKGGKTERQGYAIGFASMR